MGRIKSTLIKRTTKQLLEVSGDCFKDDFEYNKKVLGNNFGSKKIRNKIAGYITRLKKTQKNIIGG